jgi:hypothetical protein
VVRAIGSNASPEAIAAAAEIEAKTQAPSTDLVQQTIPEADTSQDYEAMLAELEQQIEGKPAEAAKEEVPQVEQVPTGGPSAPIKVAEPAATEFVVPTGFRYTLLESPAYEGLTPLSFEDADFELESLYFELKNSIT